MATIDNLLNSNSKAQQTDKVTLLPLDEIERNPLNRAPIVDIETLALMIDTHGLRTPITVYKVSNHQYRIISGERRYTAKKSLGHSDIPAFIVKAPIDQYEERLMILDSNSQREDTKEYKMLRAKEYEELYHIQKKNKQIPVGMLKQDWIGQHMGVSGRQVGRYLSANKQQIKEKTTVVKETWQTSSEYLLRDKLQTRIVVGKKVVKISFQDKADLTRIFDILGVQED